MMMTWSAKAKPQPQSEVLYRDLLEAAVVRAEDSGSSGIITLQQAWNLRERTVHVLGGPSRAPQSLAPLT